MIQTFAAGVSGPGTPQDDPLKVAFMSGSQQATADPKDGERSSTAFIARLAARGKSPPDVFPQMKTGGFHGCLAPGIASLRSSRLFVHSLLVISEDMPMVLFTLNCRHTLSP